MNEFHPKPFPAVEEPDSMEAHNVPVQHWGVGHCAVLRGSVQPPTGWGKVQHPAEQLSPVGIAEYHVTLHFTSVCNWKQDLAELLLTPESCNLLKSKEIVSLILESEIVFCYDHLGQTSMIDPAAGDLQALEIMWGCEGCWAKCVEYHLIPSPQHAAGLYLPFYSFIKWLWETKVFFKNTLYEVVMKWETVIQGYLMPHAPINQLASNPEPLILGEGEGIPDCLNTGSPFSSSEHFTTPLLPPKAGGGHPLALWIASLNIFFPCDHLSGSEHFLPVLPLLNGDTWWHGNSHELSALLSPETEGSQSHTEKIFSGHKNQN